VELRRLQSAVRASNPKRKRGLAGVLSR